MAKKEQGGNENQGEGNREAARRYNEQVRETVEHDPHENPEPHSEQEAREMQDAEKTGRQRAKEYDPAVKRDHSEGVD